MRGIGKPAVAKAVARSVSRPAGGDIDEIGAGPVASAAAATSGTADSTRAPMDASTGP